MTTLRATTDASTPLAQPIHPALAVNLPAPLDPAAQVYACLATVMDPELDESVTDLGFITEVALHADGEVQISFRLPTYFCAANFAFLMADDMRLAVGALAWVSKVQVTLGEHMYAETINKGVAEGSGFQSAFGAESDGSDRHLDALRRTFELKAFQRRQAALLQHLIDAGLVPESFMALDLGGLAALVLDAPGELLVARYLERRAVAGAAHSSAPAFVDTHGTPISATALTVHLRAIKRVAINAEFNGALCRGLQAERFSEPVPQPIHFVRRAVAVAAH